MKKIFFVALSATLLAAGCQKTEVLNQVNPVDGTSMTFAPNMGKLTKAATAEGSGETNLSEQDFRLWACYVAADPNRGAAANSIYDGMSNIIISDGPEGNAGNEWKANTTHFWPGKNKKLKFFAISANNETYGDEGSTAETGSKITVTPGETTNTMTVSNFTVDPAKPDTDLMVADYVEAAQQGSDGYTSNTVNFNFRHALTKVEFTFKNTASSIPVYVQQMYVEGIKKVGTLTVTGSNDATTMEWSAPTDTASFVGDFAADPETPALSYTNAENIKEWKTGIAAINKANYMQLTGEPETFTTWLVIPQTVYEAGEAGADPITDLKVTIAYVIKSGEEYRQFVSTFSLGTANNAVNAWGKNQYVKYNINLTPNIISFDADVEDWDPVDGEDVGVNE